MCIWALIWVVLYRCTFYRLHVVLWPVEFTGNYGILHSVVFWFGDLNFRIEGYDIHVVKSAIENDKLPLLWEKDQVNEL